MLFIRLNNIKELGKKDTNNSRFKSHMLCKFHANQLYNNGMILDEFNA